MSQSFDQMLLARIEVLEKEMKVLKTKINQIIDIILIKKKVE